MNIILPPEHEVNAELCKRSLYFFVKEFWDVIIKDPYEDNWHIEYLCDEIQLIYDQFVLFRAPHIPKDKWYDGILDDIKMNLVVNVPPGTSKSSIASRFAPAWLWSIDDTKTLISNTISGSNATEFAQASMDVINCPKYKEYFPKVKIRHGVSAKTFYQSENGGVRYSYTTKGGVTGKHAHIISDDDPMDYRMASSPAEAKAGIKGFKGLQTRKKDKRLTPYIVISQKLSNRDTTAHALKVFKGNVRHICLPAENIYKNVEPKGLTRFYDENDDLLDPKRLNRKVLMEQKMGLTDESSPISDLDYNIQYLQANESAEGLLYPSLNFVPSLPENRNSVIRFSFTDVADTGKDNFSSWFIEVNQNKIYVYDGIYTQEPSGITSKKIKGKIDLHNSIINKIETNNQGSVFITMLQMMQCNVSGYYSTGNKELRISAWAQFISFFYFVQPNTQPYHTNEYSRAIKHLQSYPATGKHEDGADDCEDSLTEAMIHLFTNYRQLFIINNQ